jgi:phosphoglycerate dehydrogenase-like enzyme
MRIVIPDDWNGAYESAPEIAELRKRAEVVVLHDRSADLAGALREADIAAALRERTKYLAGDLANMPNLKLIASVGGASNAAIDVQAATAQGTLVCYTSGAAGAAPDVAGNASMVELTIGMMIAIMRDFAQQDRVIHGGGWPSPQGRMLQGKTLGIVGLGRLGGQVAQAARLFGMRVTAAGKTLTPERAAAAGAEFLDLDMLFAECDVISVHLKLTEHTRGLVSRRLLQKMKPDAVLVNTSRGPVLDQQALVDLLRAGRIKGAALDVYDDEPLAADDPIRACERALLLGHCGWPTDGAYARMIPDTVAVIEAFLDGKPVNMVNPEALP